VVFERLIKLPSGLLVLEIRFIHIFCIQLSLLTCVRQIGAAPNSVVGH
jgi:hypothetical protein